MGETENGKQLTIDQVLQYIKEQVEIRGDRKELARKLELNKSHVNNMISGACLPTARFCKEFGIMKIRGRKGIGGAKYFLMHPKKEIV